LSAIVFTVTINLLCSCRRDATYPKELQQAERLMEPHPDSAYNVLLGMRGRDHGFGSKQIEMKYRLLMAQALNKLYLKMPSDTVFNEVVKFYDRHGSSNEKMMAHYLQGCVYRDQRQAPKALECYYQAIDCADTLSRDCDFMTMFSIYGQMADIYKMQYLPQEQIKASERYSHFAQRANDIHNSIRGIELTMGAYYIMGDTPKIIELTEECHRLYLKNRMPEAAARVYPVLIYVYLERGNYKKAHSLMLEFRNKSGVFDKYGNISKGREGYYYTVGKYFTGIHQLDSAEYYFRKLLPYNRTYMAYKGLLAVYQQKHDADSILKFSSLFEHGLEDMLTGVQSDATMHITSLYNYAKIQKEAEESAQTSERRGKIIWLAVALGLLGVTVVYLRYQRYRSRKQSELRMLNDNFLSTVEKINKANKDIQTLRENGDKLLEERSGEVRELTEELRKYRDIYDGIQSNEKESALKKSEIVSRFKALSDTYKKCGSPKKADWDNLDTLTEQCLPLFHSSITEHGLPAKELYVCILTRLGFSTGDISVIFNTSPQRVTNMKADINDKLFGERKAITLKRNLLKL
jgi:tetratricopeptide (TPR) repeat protein